MIRYKPLKHGGNQVNRPELIVVHSMAEYILDPDPVHASDFLAGYKLSAHALVDPVGNIYICREDNQRAWHARGYNTNSLGIEFLVEGEHNYGSFLEAIKGPYITTAQWEAGLDHVKYWIDTYNINRISRHSDLSPGRKVDPGEGFQWQDFLDRLGVV